jgi:hypothetical protein
MPKRTTYSAARRNLFRAIQRGDAQTTLQWLFVMDRIITQTRTLNDLDDNQCRPRPKPPKRPPQAPKGPVMLDPKGFSPGGQPNWYLNQQRLERAGLKAWPANTRRFT